MSRRKQAKPQHLKMDGDASESGILWDSGVMECVKTDVPNRIIEQTHICEKCCAEFFTWIQLNEHHKACNEDKLVLIVKNNNGMPVHQELYTISSPVPSTEYSDMSAESTDGGFELRHMFVNDDIVDRFDEGPDLEEVMELERCPMESQPLNCSRLPESSSLLMSSAGMPTTNVTLEILHSTRVAVAQFSQGLNSWGIGGKAVSAAIPVILEHLLALQQQQVHQLHLIDQICSQVTVIKKHSPQPGIPPVSSSISDIPNPFPTQEGISPSVLRQSGLMSLFINEQAVPSLSSVPEKSQRSPVQIISKETCRAVTHPTLSSENIDPLLTGSSSSSSSNTNSQINSIGCTETLSTSSPASMEQSRFLSSSSRLAFLPQRSPSNDIIFPNPQANITSTANTLNPHATLIKHRKGKLPNITSFKAKLSPEESLFKHKCRFCTKVFGSDSALQIHLRSHTGERPFKCNICGNRFSTKGNLKVHFQRHKDKYPHVQMNPCPVPEYLNNIPTNSEIPYGMPVTSKKNVFSWLDNKPVVATLPATICLPHNTTSSNIGGSNDSDGVAIPIKSLCHLAPFSPIQRRSDAASVSPQSSQETEASDIDKKEDIVKAPVISSTSSLAIAAVPFTSLSPVSCSSLHSLMSDEFKQPADSMQTSETLKLQQLVENIHKKMTDPNQCILCHRVLSCQSALKMHYRIHTGKRTHKCKVCGRAFITKGNLKAHFGIHRENPFNVQHPCTNCQKKFTSAVALQQHIHMPMLSQIPDSTLVDGFQEIDISVSVTARNVDSLCSNHKNIDGISMNDEEEDEELKDMEEGINPFKPLIPICNCPKFSTNISSMAALENQNSVGMILMPNKASNVKSPTTGFYDSSQINTKCDLSEKKRVNCYEIITNLSEFYSSPSASVSHIQRNSESMMARSADTSNGPDSSEHLMASVKKKQSESVTSSSAAAMSQFVAGMQARMLGVKEKALYSTLFQQSREQVTDQNIPSLAIRSSASGLGTTEVNRHIQENKASERNDPQFTVHIPPTYASVSSSRKTSLLSPATPRRTLKKHNCTVCGKNFSSVSALQIHERTHTGEKPFVCSICGRAFTTKGNLKVHMGTHMLNNAPSRRGRRLSVENSMALLGEESVKLGEMIQKDLAIHAMNVNPGFRNRYAAAITSNLTTKNNEISVIQRRGTSQLHTLTTGMDRMSSIGGPINKTSIDVGHNRQFSL